MSSLARLLSGVTYLANASPEFYLQLSKCLHPRGYAQREVVWSSNLHVIHVGMAAVDGVIKLPDGTELPVDAAKAKALVTPAAFADAVSDTLEKVRLMGVERRVLEETAEEIRQVAKEARAVIEEAYDGETLDAFSEALAPAFKNSLSPDFYKPTPATEIGD